MSAHKLLTCEYMNTCINYYFFGIVHCAQKLRLVTVNYVSYITTKNLIISFLTSIYVVTHSIEF